MSSRSARLELDRPRILAHRRRVGALDRRLPSGSEALRAAASAGLQDSMPRAALLSIHARVEGTAPSTWEDPALVQLWGPRFSAFVVPAADVAVFSLGRLPTDEAGRQRATDLADRLERFLEGRRMDYAAAGRALGEPPNRLRYAAPTGRVLIRWDGARRPVVWTVPAPPVDPAEARLELARRFIRVVGPATPAAFGTWAGIGSAGARATFEALGPDLTAVRTPIGDGWILAADEGSFRTPATAGTGARLLPSGDPYTLLQGVDRELLVPDPARRAALWTPRVWPGALLVGGEVVGTWRRADAVLTVEPWDRLSGTDREAVEAEAAALPLPGAEGRIAVRWVT